VAGGGEAAAREGGSLPRAAPAARRRCEATTDVLAGHGIEAIGAKGRRDTIDSSVAGR
jgi:hypothetical protein